MFFGGGGGGRGGRRRNRGPRRGSDLQMHVRLTFMEAVFGAEKEMKVKYQHTHKSGEVTMKEREVKVKIPPGIDNGMNLRLQGQGAEGDPGAPPGNLLVQVIVDSDDHFQREGYDVHTETRISFVQAILGGSVDVRTLKGEVELKIPQGCQPDTKLMLRGKGIQELNGTRKGDHIVHISVEIPKRITKKQEELLRKFDSAEEEEEKGGFAKSAFQKLFGGEEKKQSGTNVKDSVGGNAAGDDADDTVEEKKTA